MKTTHVTQRRTKTTSTKSSPAPRPFKARKHTNGNGGRRTTPTNGGLVHSIPMINGVNVNDLVLMTESIKQNPDLAEYSFRSTTKWVDGAYSKTRIQGFWGSGREDNTRERPFVMELDEPKMLLGTNRGPNAVEAALSALGSCLAVGVAYNAAARGIKLDALDIDIEGDLDLRGFLGIPEDGQPLRAAYDNVRVICRVKSDALPSEIKDLVEFAQETSPVLDLFRHPVPVTVELEH